MSATTMPFDANNAEGTAIVQLLLQRQDRLENRIDQHFAAMNERFAAIERNQQRAPVHEMAPGTMAWFALLAVLAISVIVGLIFVGGGGLGGG